MLNKKTSRIGSIIAFVLSALFIVTAVWLFLNRQYVLDQIAVWGYAPSADIQQINQRVAFTDRGEFVFYATKPEVQNPEAFNKECPRQEAGSPILGCYTTDDRIYIYNLTNKQLDGMEEVTAAHEMLHAVWYRTPADEREKLAAELKDAYSKLDNPSLKTRMEYYERTEPGELINELHSILGTEVVTLNDSLEAYYEQFFDRETVLAFHQQYNTVYTALNIRADDLYEKMASLSTTIQTRSKAYDTAAARLSADIEAFNARAQSGAFSSQAQFYAERAALIRRSNTLEVDRAAINVHIETHNAYYEEYKEIAAQIEVLNDSIDSYNQLDQGPSV